MHCVLLYYVCLVQSFLLEVELFLILLGAELRLSLARQLKVELRSSHAIAFTFRFVLRYGCHESGIAS